MELILLHELSYSRSCFYTFLSTALYSDPSPEKFKIYFEHNVFEDLVQAGEINKNIQYLAEFFQAEKSEEEYKKLYLEHRLLFSGSGKLIAPPWGSVYLSREHIIFDEHTLAVKEFYKANGYEVLDMKKGPEDHIGLELSFISNLNSRLLVELKSENPDEVKIYENLKTQIEFINNQILTWFDKFANLIYQAENTVFYKNIVEFLDIYLKEDIVELESVLKQFNNKF